MTRRSTRLARRANRVAAMPISDPVASGPERGSGLDGPSGLLRRDTQQELDLDREAIERSLATVCADEGLRASIAAHEVLSSGGKRARPLLSCAILRALDRDPTEHVEVIAAVELAHTGSLLHDDIIDDAQTRRGRRCAHLAFDVPTAILGGDLLIVAAIERISRASSSELRSSFSAALKDLCTGEALERQRRFDPEVDLAHTRLVNRLKTASLFAYASEAGAILGHADPSVRSAARVYGLAVGEAFQLTDDLLDLRGDPSRLGKSIGMDLFTGCVTVPVAIALERDATLRNEVVEVWRTSGDNLDALTRLRDRMEKLGAFAATGRLANALANRACAAVECLPTTRWSTQLIALARAATLRQS